MFRSRFEEFSRSHLSSEQFQSIWEGNRIEVFDGDIEKSNLGLSEAALAEIKASATIFIHAASSINLQRSLSLISKSVIQPSLQMADLALVTPTFRQFVYVSTAYANAHLHTVHNGIDTHITEEVHPLRPSLGDTTDFEYSDLLSSCSTPEFSFHDFPFPYAYAKHLTERLLLSRLDESKLLILRPSIIGPALAEPYPYYELPGSAPATSFLAAVIPSLSLSMGFASRFPDPYRQSNIDEMPVDLVVNRLLMHLAHRTTGIVHAAAGKAARRSFANLWEKAMSERRLPWSPRLSWSDTDWRDKSLHPIARIFVVLGTSYVFDGTRTEELWERMSEEEKELFPCWLQSLEQNGDMMMRRKGVEAQVTKYFARKKLPSVFIRLLIRDPIVGVVTGKALGRVL